MKPEEIERIKGTLPTTLGSDEIRERYSREILARSVLSARMASASYLAKIREVCTAMSAGEIDKADARAQLLAVLEQMGHSPRNDGGIANPASIRRLNLILDTQTQMASSVARLAGQTEATVEAFPAWELTRLETRRVPRDDWRARWRAAGSACGWQGACKDQFIALKNSPIWAALGDGAGGFDDTLGNPYPPFAYSSGLDWLDVDRETAAKLGLLDGRGAVASEPPSVATLSPGESDIADAIARYGFPEIGGDLT